MYFREKRSGGRTYLQIVEGYREHRCVRQRVVATLGRLDQLRESGQLESLLASGARFSEKISVMGAHVKGELEPIWTKKVGPGLVMDRLWEETGIGGCLREHGARRRYRFEVERAVYLTVVHRLFDPGSDRAAEKWREDYVLRGGGVLQLQHLYRAMAWLGGEREGRREGELSPRCVKDEIEEQLFFARRDLFSELVVVFFDTTSVYFEGEGGERLGRRGKSKDHRPDLKQMVVGFVVDGSGRPVCCEMWPGNTTDVKTMGPVVKRLRERFGIERICIVADRGMISAGTIEGLEAREDLEYILGARMRGQKEVKEEVVSRAGRYREVHGSRQRSKDPSPLKVKEVWVGERRYVVCYNEEQARKDASDRAAIVEKLKETLKQGDKALVGNKGYRKYLRNPEGGFSIDEEKIKGEARYDGKWVLRTNSRMSAEEVALTYKQLWMVEAINRTVKSVLETRPVYHKCDETIRGHVFCSFLSLIVMRELQDRMERRGWGDAEWADVLRDLDNLEESEVEARDGKRFVIRGAAKGWSGKALQAVGVAMPPTIRLAGEAWE